MATEGKITVDDGKVEEKAAGKEREMVPAADNEDEATDKCSGTPEREQYLPVDLLIEIVARSDITTVVRCTTTSRILRRAILEPAFRGRLAADGGSFDDPALLLGVSIVSAELAHRVIHNPCSAQPRVLLGASSIGDLFEPVASHDGLLLSQRYNEDNHQVELRVYDTLTGHTTPLPQFTVSTYGYVFRRVGNDRESYELLVADICMRFQTFSSKHGQWGAVRQLSVTEQDSTYKYRLADLCPAVVGRTVYWACIQYKQSVRRERILAMDFDAAEGTIMEIPPACMQALKKDTHLFVASVCGFLSLVIVDSDEVSMWTLTPASSPQSTETWSRQLLIDKMGVEKVAALVDNTSMPFDVEGFWERSGSVIVRVGKGDLLRLDVETKVIKGDVSITGAFLHETNLVSLLQAIKY